MIIDKYKNIIDGTPLQLTPLDCGYYARRFGTLSPTTYVTYESPHINTGDRSTGTTYVNYYKEYGSRITASYELDGSIVNTDITVVRNAIQNDAAADLANKLYQFLGTAIAAFNMAGANYSQLQDSIRNSIPALLNSAASVNETLQQEGQVLAGKEAIFEEADSEFHHGLSLWLPMFFLIPGGLALLTYCLMTLCKDTCTAEDAVQNDIEAPAPRYKPEIQPQPETPMPPPPVYRSGSDNPFDKDVELGGGDTVEGQPQPQPPVYSNAPAEYSPAYFTQHSAQKDVEQDGDQNEGQPGYYRPVPMGSV